MARDVMVVIGAGDMGMATARRVGSGSHLLIADLDEGILAEARARLHGEGHEVTTHSVDVASPESVDALARAAAELGPVTRVVHTAGLSPNQGSVQRILSVDLVGVALVLEAFRDVIAPGGAGVVVASMIGSLYAGQLTGEQARDLATAPAAGLADLPSASTDRLTDGQAAYGYAKRGNQLRVQAEALQWGARGARLNSVSPGVVSTRMSRPELEDPQGPARAMVDGSAVPRLGSPDDVAAVVAFLLGRDSGYVSGTDILVDGGVVASIQVGSAG
ncbi:SDR family oxidoreductase [Nocardiopsis sp. HNM0947]|uniref:SDR family oxidoreductase n=1 Tax=Nocardiopsis coralli TaxID=2772213 RepID=A0ABR9P441_9ACTN|nr:SDR family oxidoreductase [Nocardiopsis coralli]MBE2998614.1 SDR family oxidoreductase [Nocardiopsis coralli]